MFSSSRLISYPAERASCRGRGFGVADVIAAVLMVGVLGVIATTLIVQKVRSTYQIDALDTLSRIRDAISRSGRPDHAKVMPTGRLAQLVGAEGHAHRLCASATPVPKSFHSVRGRVYRSRTGDWTTGTKRAGWRCIGVHEDGPQRYQFGYNTRPGDVSGAREGFYVWARGDLDGDGRHSLIRMDGDLVDGKVVHQKQVTIFDGAE